MPKSFHLCLQSFLDYMYVILSHGINILHRYKCHCGAIAKEVKASYAVPHIPRRAPPVPAGLFCWTMGVIRPIGLFQARQTLDIHIHLAYHQAHAWNF